MYSTKYVNKELFNHQDFILQLKETFRLEAFHINNLPCQGSVFIPMIDGTIYIF